MSWRIPVEEAAEARALAVDETSLRLVDLALDEDIGPGDWTTRWTVPPRARVEGAFVAAGVGVIAGVAVAAAAFRRLSPRVEVVPEGPEGMAVVPGDVFARVRGPARAILAAERTALDFLRRLSGVATFARSYVDAVEGTGTLILGAGNGTPGWRLLEAAAVRAGGAHAHRLGLHDGVVVRPAHVALAGSVAQAVRKVREQNARGLRVEVEASGEAAIREAVAAGADVVLLRHGDPSAVRAAARILVSSEAHPVLVVAASVDPAGARELADAGAEALLIEALPQGAPPLPITFSVTSG